MTGAMVAPGALVALPGHGDWQPGMVGLRKRIAVQAATRPDATALEGIEGAQITWACLGRATQNLSEALLELGAGRGRVVLAELGNGPEAGGSVLGAVAKLVNTCFAQERIGYIV